MLSTIYIMIKIMRYYNYGPFTCCRISGYVTTIDVGDNDNGLQRRTVSCPDRSNARSVGLHTHTHTHTHARTHARTHVRTHTQGVNRMHVFLYDGY